jgi:hypothetical protein
MQILIYSHMDALQMYHDLEWQSSPDFIVAGEQAMSCANVSHNQLLLCRRKEESDSDGN